MLHNVLLRLSCFIGLFCLVIGSAIHLFKKDIVLFALQRTLPKTTITCDGVSGFVPLTTSIHNLKIVSDNVGIVEVDTATLTLDPFHVWGNAKSSGDFLFQIDALRLEGLHFKKTVVSPSDVSPSKLEFPAPPSLSQQRPKIAIKTFAIDGAYYLDEKSPVQFNGKGAYFYDTANLDYRVSTQAFTNEGHVNIIKMDDLNIQTHLMGMPLNVSLVTTDIKSIPFWFNLGDHAIEGTLSDRGNDYQLQATYGKDKTIVTAILWDKKDKLTLQKLTTQYGHHRLALESPSIFDINTQHFNDDLHLSLDHQKIIVQRLGFSPTLSGHITMRQANLDLFKKDFPALDMNGNSILDVNLDGTFDNPHITVNLTSDGLKHRTLSALRIVKAHMKALYKDHTLMLNGLIDGKHDLNIKMTGTATQKNLSITTDIKGTLRHIKKILPMEDHIDGEFKGTFTTTGDLLSPKTSGDITFTKGLYENFIIGTHIKNLNGKALLKDNNIHIHLHGSDDFKGTLKGEGHLNLNTFSGEVRLDLHQFYLGQSDLFTGKADGALTLNLDKKSITGELHLDPVIVDIDQLTPSATPKIHFIEKTIETEDSHNKAPAIVESPFVFNINLIPKNKVIVRGFGIESTWKGSMAIQGQRPDFVGKFLLDKGTIDITGRILNFTKGIITFDHKINEPYLDLEITKKIDNYDVYVQLQGRPLDSKFTFLSSPALTQEEVLALILLGRKSAAASLGQLFDISASLSSLSSAGQDKSFFTTFRKVFGIEALEIKKQDQTSASEAPQAISIRKQISTDFSVVIEQTLNATEDESKRSKAIIEKQINDNWNVECDVSTDKSGSIGLNWVKRY